MYAFFKDYSATIVMDNSMGNLLILDIVIFPLSYGVDLIEPRVAACQAILNPPKISLFQSRYVVPSGFEV